MERQQVHSPSVMIEATGVDKSYRNGATSSQVLKGVSLTVRAGEFVFLLGPSGSGKSTLLSILGCVLSADAGRVAIRGRDISNVSPTQLADFRRNHLGFVFQRFHLFSGLSALENVRVTLDLRGVRKSAGSQAAAELLAAVGLGDKLASDIRTLSVGQRQRVAVARALVGDPDLILADEPTASLDAASGQTTIELLRRLAKQREKTVIVVTHDARILPYADRVLHLEDGILADEVPHTVEAGFGETRHEANVCRSLSPNPNATL